MVNLIESVFCKYLKIRNGLLLSLKVYENKLQRPKIHENFVQFAKKKQYYFYSYFPT